MNELSVNVEKMISAPVEKVFNAWLAPEILSQFMLPMPGMPNPLTQVDTRVGGGFTIHMQVGEKNVPHTGKYLQIDSPRKMVFTWQSPFSIDGSTVTIDFISIDSRTTKVKLSHVKFPDEESCENHQWGWNNILLKLNEIVA